jgi:hypothetical protein
VFDLLFHEWVESDSTKGFYTRVGCEKLVAKMNAEDKSKGRHYVRLQNGFVGVASGWNVADGWCADAPVRHQSGADTKAS